MGSDALGNWIPDDDSRNDVSTPTIDAQIAETQTQLNKLKESIRIAKQSLANIDPKYESNKAYIAKLNTTIETDQKAYDSLEGKLSSLKKQKENATKKPAATTNKNKQAVASDDALQKEQPVTGEVKKNTKNRTWNPLGKFSSYTYKLSLYMLSGDAISNHNKTGVWNTKQMELVAQSAGVNDKVDSPRAAGFDYDFYIDNLQITNQIGAAAAQFSGTTTDVFFEIYEPYGMTFPSRLLSAAQAIDAKSNSKMGAATQIGEAMSHYYLIVIRFFGYDEKGAVVTASKPTVGDNAKTDNLGSFERAIPIGITEFKTRLDNKIVKYQIKATPHPELAALSMFTGVVNEQVNIAGDSVSDVLSTGVTSLQSILNEKEEALVKSGKKKIANKYKIVFEELSGIESALLVDKNHYVPGQTPISGLPGPVNVRVAESGKGATVSKQKRTIQVPAHTPIPQIIEQVISQSTFISDCLSIINKEETQPVTENAKTFSTNPSPQIFNWFTIVPQITLLGKDTDTKTDAFEITYFVVKKSMPFIRSPYIPKTDSYPGPHKIYNYWYTGQNEGVLSLEISYNNLYASTASLFSDGFVKNEDTAPVRLVAASSSATPGVTPGTSEEVASFKSWLYAPGDQQTANMKILGDPDFLFTAQYGTFDEMTSTSVSDEAPINPLDGQVFIEVDMRSVNDYSNKTGVMKPEKNLIFWNYTESMQKQTEGRMLYMISTVKSKFVRGQFTQEFPEMTIPNVSVNGDKTSPNGETQREGSATAKSTPTQADVRKIDNKTVKPTQVAEDDNSYDAMGNYQGIPSSTSYASDTKRETPVSRGRGSTRTYETTNKTRILGK